MRRIVGRLHARSGDARHALERADTDLSGKAPMSVAVIESTTVSESRLIVCAVSSALRTPTTTIVSPLSCAASGALAGAWVCACATPARPIKAIAASEALPLSVVICFMLPPSVSLLCGAVHARRRGAPDPTASRQSDCWCVEERSRETRARPCRALMRCIASRLCRASPKTPSLCRPRSMTPPCVASRPSGGVECPRPYRAAHFA
jgi:hypothetical protein